MNVKASDAGPGFGGRTAVVTGAGSGIGRATALEFARRGAHVVCTDLDGDAAAATAAEIRTLAKTPPARDIQLDVADERGWETLAAAATDGGGPFDILVNCAGVSSGGTAGEIELAEWQRVMSVNLQGAFLGTKHAMRAMAAAGRGGVIVNVASVSGIKPQPGASAYCASKAALIMFTRTVALECAQAQNGVRVNCISPGGVKTPMWESMPFFQDLVDSEGSTDAAFNAMTRGSPGNRWALPGEVADAILFLASDAASFINGTNLVFDDAGAA